MKPIWYFVGLILLSMGALIFLAGLYMFVNPAPSKTVLADTHPNIWWGGIMIASGLLFVFKNRNIKV